MPEAVLFDLGAALNRVRQDYDLPPLPLATLRPHTSQGGRGLLRVGMGVTPQDDSYAELYRRFIQRYEERLCHHTTLFPGMAELLAQLEQRRIPWGVVTNKSERLTHPLLQQMDLAHRCACIVCGDSTPNPKPAPDPLLLAAQLLGLPTQDCCYLGDDLRDIQAGNACAMMTIGVRWGYLGTEHPPETWGADHLIDHPDEVSLLLRPAR